MWLAIPVKDFKDAKQRLNSVLSAPERAEFYHAMLEDVLAAATKAQGLSGIALVTRDAQANALAGRLGLRILREPANLGHTQAVTFASRLLAKEGHEAMMTMPGDVPLASSAEIDAALQVHQSAPAVTIVPARDEAGSNAVICSPPEVMPLRFGDNSFHPHLERARELGITPTIFPCPGIGLDIDSPSDLDAFLAIDSDTHARRYLESSGIARRLITRNGSTNVLPA